MKSLTNRPGQQRKGEDVKENNLGPKPEAPLRSHNAYTLLLQSSNCKANSSRPLIVRGCTRGSYTRSKFRSIKSKLLLLKKLFCLFEKMLKSLLYIL